MSRIAKQSAGTLLSSRRTILKSAGAMLGGSVLSNAAPRAFSQSGSKETRGTEPFHKGQVGFQLAGEQFTLPQLVDFGVACEEAGFDVLAFSDHFQPWQENEKHSTLAWVTMAAIGQRTKRIWMGMTVTCPTFRYNPAVVAED